MSARRYSNLIRWSTSTALVGTCVLVGAGFWLTTEQADASILGRYSVQWFMMAVCANLACMLLGFWGTRGIRRDSPEGSSLGKKVLFSGRVDEVPWSATFPVGEWQHRDTARIIIRSSVSTRGTRRLGVGVTGVWLLSEAP